MQTLRQVLSILLILSTAATAAQTYLSGEISGTYDEPIRWTKEASPYIILDSVIVNKALQIDAGTVVMFRYHPDPDKKSYMVLKSGTIGEEILCNGTPDDPVVFTSERDDAFGDLNGDSSVTIPRPGDWGYIRYQSKTGFSFSSFNHAVFRFGGGRDPGGIASPEFFPMLLIDNTDDFSTTTVNSCTVQYSAGVGIMNGSADITKSTISDCTHGILLNTSEGSVQQSLFTRNAKYPICIKGMWISSWESDHPTESIRLGGNMADNTFTENGQNFFAIEGDVLVPEVINPEGIAIRWERSTIPYLITGPLRIVYPEGRNLGSLSIERGTLIKFKHYREYARKPYIEIHPGCKLIAGMTGDPGDVVFTSEYDHRYDYELYTGSDRDPMPGDWGYIEGSSFELSNCVLKYGGVYYNPQTGRIPADSSAVLRIRVGDSGSTQITSCLFNSLYRDGITFLCEDVVDYGAHVDTSSFLMEKEAYAIRILKEDDVNRLDVFADLNFWNGKFGPYNPVSNPSGNGCRVDNNVHFDPYLSSSDDELDLESSVVWGWTMNTDLDTVPNVLVKMIGKREQNVHSNAEGKYYMSNVYPGFGYKMKGFAPRHKNGLVEDIVVEKDYSHQMDMVLEPRTIDYLLDTITFKVNPEVSEVQEGGTAYRYYKIIDRKTHDPVYGAEVFVNGLGDTLYSNHKGIVTIPISSNKLNGYPNGRNFYISRVGLETLPYPPEMRMNFRVNPLPRDYTKMWGGKLWLKEGISIIELKQETGASIGLAMEDRGSGEEPVNLILERGFQAGAGINLGASAKLTLGPVEAGAEAEVGVNLNALMKDQFIFDYENSSGKLALAKFIVLAGSAFQYLDSPLHRYLGVALLDKNELVAEASFSNSVGLNLHGYGSAEAGLDINLLDSKRKGGVIGAELKGNAEAEGDLDFLFTSYTHKDQLDFRLSYKAEIGVGASAGVGVDLAELFGGGDDDGNDSGKDKDNDKDDDTEIDIDFLSKDLLSAGVSAGVKYGVSISTTRGIPKPYTSLGFMYGYKYDANAEAIFLGGVEAKADREYEFTFDLHDAYLKGILEEKVQLANEIANTDMSNLSLDISSLSAAKIFESPLATFAAEQTRNAFSFPPVPYTQTVTDLVDEGEFKLEISFGIGPVKAKFGAGIEYAEANDYLWKSGVFYDWRLYPLQSYDYVAENDDLSVGPILQDILTESGKYMWKRIKDALNPLPRIFKKIKIWPFNKIRWKGAGDYYHIPVGPESRNSFLVADSITTSEDSLFVYYWDWYGTGEEDQSKGTMDSEELRILEYVKSKAVELHKLDYGIGGFYQFEPNGMLVADSAVLTINYFPEELDVMLPDSTEYTIDENDLRMYVEDKTNNRWICVGGVVEPDSNFVTARIDSLGTFTLAPFTPYGEIVLTASPDSIFVEESDSSHITSNVIYYNTGVAVQDEEFTIEVSKGTITTADANPTAAGIQVRSVDGKISFDYHSDSISGVAYLKARSRMGSAAGLTKVSISEKVSPQAPVITSAVLNDYSVELSWEPSPDIDVANYMVYFSTRSGHPYKGTASILGEPSPVKAGTATGARLKGLHKDSTYYFALQAIDRSGNASDYSNEMVLETRFNYRPSIYSRVLRIDPVVPAGTVVDTLWADDEDRDQELRFYLAANNRCTAFAVDTITGIIRVKDAAQLDYWLTGVHSFDMQVGVRDNAENSMSDSTLIRIDLNVITGMRRAPIPGEFLFNMYPNPAGNELNIDLGKQEIGAAVSIIIVNLQGQVMLRREIVEGAGGKHRLNLTGIPDGLHTVVVESGSGRAIQRLVLIR